MMTKYGELKRVGDIFEEVGDKVKSGSIDGPNGTWEPGFIYKQKFRCKLCGDEIITDSFKGACYLTNSFQSELRQHIEIHTILVTLLN